LVRADAQVGGAFECRLRSTAIWRVEVGAFVGKV